MILSACTFAGAVLIDVLQDELRNTVAEYYFRLLIISSNKMWYHIAILQPYFIVI